MMKDEDFKLLKGFDYRQTNLTDICETEKQPKFPKVF